jgi:preQ(0) biosynthesis protein QueC
VPFRNANLLSMAVSFAETAGCSRVVIGAHSEDYAGYPDCRPAFFDAFQHVADLGTKPETSITIASPFATWSKTEIVRRGSDLGVPLDRRGAATDTPRLRAAPATPAPTGWRRSRTPA